MEVEPAVRFTVYGIPAPKGSKSAFAVRRGGVLTGQVAVKEGRTDSFKDWNRRLVEVIQREAEAGAPLLDEPLFGQVEFYLPKPKSAPKTRKTWPTKKPDLDKLIRAVLDAMSGVLVTDDARFVELRLSKHYANDHEFDQRPRAEVTVWPVSDP